MTSITSAVNAYNNQLKLAKGSASGEADDSNATGSTGGFSDILEGQLNDVINTQKTAESAKMSAITGSGDITDLVTAIANAEMALNTIVTIRDRAISAYQDIIRMPI